APWAHADLHRRGRLDCCITQNIDNLHQAAGLPPEKVIELHGNATRARCLACGAAYTRDEVHVWLEAGDGVPACPACGGIVKPAALQFGEGLPAREQAEAARGGGQDAPYAGVRPVGGVVLDADTHAQAAPHEETRLTVARPPST